LHTGQPKAGASFINRYEIGCGQAEGESQFVDSLHLAFRYRAAPMNASNNNTPAVLKVSLINADTRPVAVVAAAVPIGNFSELTGYSAPVHINATNLKAACDAGLGSNPRGRLLVQFSITNNDRPVIIPVDDLAGGFAMRVGWLPPA
jgi:hypothetical protein